MNAGFVLEKRHVQYQVLATETPLFVAVQLFKRLQVRKTKAALSSLKPPSIFPSLAPFLVSRVSCEVWGLRAVQRFRGAIGNTRSRMSSTLQLLRLDQVYKKHMWKPTTLHPVCMSTLTGLRRGLSFISFSLHKTNTLSVRSGSRVGFCDWKARSVRAAF